MPSSPPALRAVGDAGRARRQFARLQPRLAVGRGDEDHGVVDRRGPDRLVGRSGGAMRAGWIEPVVGIVAGERRGALLQRGLPLQQRVELLLELLLVEQLPAGDAVDLGAQFGDAVLVGELHFGLAADQAREHVVAEGEIGAGGDRPDAP